MMTSLTKGQKADLTKTNPGLNNLIVGMGWKTPNSSIEVDFSAFLLSATSKVTKDEDLIFYGNPQGPGGSITVIESGKQNYSGLVDQAQLSINLQHVPSSYERISFALTIYEGEKRGQNFSHIDDSYIRIIDSLSGKELIHYNIGKDFSVETAIVVGELYRYNGEWKFNAIGSGYSGGLEALCSSFGIEVKSESVAPPTPPSIPPINLQKIELKKRGDVINLQKNAGPMGEILVNLNWNQKSPSFFRSKGVDLDLACLFEMKDGGKGAIQALGNSFGDLNRYPYISLDGDDRTGSVTTGENLRINGKYLSEIERIVIYAFIYEGITNWSEADGLVTIKQAGGPDIEVRLTEHNNHKRMCAIAMIRNVNNQTFSIERLVEYHQGHKEMDAAYNWNMRWTAGSK
ncbi:tellurite resistance protein TerA [Paenibacillus shirakamiensis]|uniref:Tellurite resistance protein TerA n=1 Tax=Paenibacillus shirakamiensis TaxID=1265935 RepID=A0ABS4JGK1_9BACL|nr:TerD family protein [Paenibacillus shirakamiensis]MBP2000844.1 tellurite resistance protein TerA [Paenibacillus shirakamiensis]